MPDTLAQAIRKKYPQSYKNWNDQQLEEAILKNFKLPVFLQTQLPQSPSQA